jgi:ABC-2 type transport system permease protein
MPRALWLLLRLHFSGVFRRLLRDVRTPKGFTFLILGILVCFSWLGPALYRATRMPRTDPQIVRTVAPFAILGFCIGNLLASFGEKAVAFTAAEVDFLFPAPFTRRSLLGFKILKTVVGTTVTTFVFSVLLLRYSRWWLACWIGVWLTIQFMQLFAIAVMVVGETIGERIYGVARRGILLTVLVIAVIAIAPKIVIAFQHGPVEFMTQIHATTVGRIVLAPFDVFVRAITADNLAPDLVKWASIALMIDVLMLTLVLVLDANYLETAATVSQKRHERSRRMRRGGISGMSGAATTFLKIRPLPRLGGAGPIVWRQLTGAVRSSRGLIILLAIVAAAGTGILMGRHHSDSSMSPLVSVAIWINLLLVSMLKFDFRDELDRLDLLRSLPVSPAAVATAEVMAPVLVLTIVQMLLLLAAAVLKVTRWQILLTAASFAVPFNLLLVGLENLLYLMFPLRSAGLIAGDMQLFGRQMVVFVCKFLLLIVGVAIAAGVGLIGYILGNKSWPLFGVFAWVGLVMVALSIIPVIARVYARFDPSIDTPA